MSKFSNDSAEFTEKKKKPSLATQAYYLAVRAYLQVLARIAPKSAAKIAVGLFTTPALGGPKNQLTWPDSITDFKQERLTVRENVISVYLVGTSPKRVLLCHGWGGAAVQFLDLVTALIACGFSVIAFDAPAHGTSEGKQTDIIDFAEAINAIVRTYGVPYGIVGHSFGAAGAAYALNKFNIRVERCVLISSFGTATWTFDNFGRTLGLPKPVVDEMRRMTANKHEKTEAFWLEFDVGEMVARSRVRTILIHDQDDREIPHDQALHIAKKCDSNLKLFSTTGLGHRRIVRDSEVIGLVTECMRIDVTA